MARRRTVIVCCTIPSAARIPLVGGRGDAWLLTIRGWLLLALLIASRGHAADVTFTIDTTSSGTPISPHVYGINNFGNQRFAGSGYTGVRFGGNRWTGYNWETNASNAGEDFFNFSDDFLVNFRRDTPAGEAVRPGLVAASVANRYVNITVPIAGYVAADNNGEVFPTQAAPSSRWREVRARKSSVYPGDPLSRSPNRSDGYVFTDEYVNWVETQRRDGQQVFYTLDNEPALWDLTHPLLWGSTNPTFAEYGALAIEHAGAIKDTQPDAIVLGGALFGWSAFKNLGGASDYDQRVPAPRDPQALDFNRWLLATLAAEESTQGRVLMDALDLHWYSEARGNGVRITGEGALDNSPGVVAARIQAPRSLWDPTYVESSWITQFSTNGAPIQLLNRVQADIDELKPGTKISISEYNHGGGNHISGGIAQADTLGIFGREGVFSASWWSVEGEGSRGFVEGAFEVFRDFDGEGGRFGDLSLPAETNDVAASSIYASRVGDGSGEVVLVAINKTAAPLAAELLLAGGITHRSIEVFQLTSADPSPQPAGTLVPTEESLVYQMPAYSVSTLRFTDAAPPGDFNGDGVVDASDYTVWRDTRFSTTDLRADANGNGFVDANDYTFWSGNYGLGVDPSAEPIPEPGMACLASIALASPYLLRPIDKNTPQVG